MEYLFGSIVLFLVPVDNIGQRNGKRLSFEKIESNKKQIKDKISWQED
jgi:hypothetical protein